MSYILDSGVDLDRPLTSKDLMGLCSIVITASSMTQDQLAIETGVGFNTAVSAACRNPDPRWDYARQRIVEWDIGRTLTKIVTTRTRDNKTTRDIYWEL